jgi:hypothetical protein
MGELEIDANPNDNGSVDDGANGDAPKRSVKVVDALLASEMLSRHSGTVGTLCFVVRRPG